MIKQKEYKTELLNIHLDIDELSLRLGGGIPRGSIVLIEGPLGSGRSVLCQRILYGLLANHQSATYVSTELTMRDFIDQMTSLGYDISRHIMSRALQFFPVYPLIGQASSRVNFMDRLIDSPILYEKDVLFVDSLSTLTKDTLDEQSCIRLVGFMKRAMKLQKTMILTIEEGFPGMDPLRQAADIYMTLNMRASSHDIVRSMHMKRYQRARGQLDDIILFRIEPGFGLVIEITEVSG
ncbi:MAG: AAA family ATPase [Euryarchaeota archaeon]|nr:AAA family ATPase [Euryarchaeota archaeon]